MSACQSASVAILMCTYNGGRFIAEQLDTIARQTHPNWRLLVSDDGSTDETLVILSDYANRWAGDRLRVRPGPERGFCYNFLSLACTPGELSDFYAFADQDDLWQREKIARALAWIETIPPDVPALYCGRTRAIDAFGTELGLSTLFRRPPSLRNALVQSIAGGNTMVFNEAARKLLAAAGADVMVPSHDWWLYILVTGCGGVVHYDPTPMVCYRQHSKNLIGANASVSARIRRLALLMSGRFQEWNAMNLVALSRVSRYLSPDSVKLLEKFEAIRCRRLGSRLLGLFRGTFYRQTLLGQAGLLLAVILKKV